jgi:hypothetical protein
LLAAAGHEQPTTAEVRRIADAIRSVIVHVAGTSVIGRRYALVGHGN